MLVVIPDQAHLLKGGQLVVGINPLVLGWMCTTGCHEICSDLVRRLVDEHYLKCVDRELAWPRPPSQMQLGMFVSQCGIDIKNKDLLARGWLWSKWYTKLAIM
jgi:hypothetical protein